MIPLLVFGIVGLALSSVHILGYVDDVRRERRRQRALDSLRWPE